MQSHARPVRLLVGAAVFAATLVLTTSSAGAVAAADEASLRAAFESTEAVITLTADVELTCAGAGGGGAQLYRPAGAPAVTVSGAFTITQTCAGNRVIGAAGPTGELTLEGVTVTGGSLSDDLSAQGGGILWPGDILLDGAVITDNSATGAFGGLGGGVSLSGRLAMDGATVSDNTAGSSGDFGGNGGGIRTGTVVAAIDSTISGNIAEGGLDFAGTGGGISGNGDVTVVRSTISGNEAEAATVTASSGNGGGIVTNADLTAIDSTVTDNVASGAQSNNGGVAAGGITTIAYSTIVGNAAATAANVQAPSDEDVLIASVISDPLAGGANCGPGSVAGASQGHMYVDDGSCNVDHPTDTADADDPMLGALGDNGGPTETRLPAAGSPLLDAVTLAFCAADTTGIGVDQRGIVRPQGAGCDIGAVEVSVATPPGPDPDPEPDPDPDPGVTPSSPTGSAAPARATPASPVRATPGFVG